MLNVRRHVFGYLCACARYSLSLSLSDALWVELVAFVVEVAGGWWLENDIRELVRVFVSWVRLCVQLLCILRNTEKRINVCGAGGTERDVNSVI